MNAMNAGRRYPTLVRSVAAAAALALAAQGSGVPMCVSLLAEAVAPCAMHAPGAQTHPTHDARIATIAAAPSGHGACHLDAANTGCTAGGGCPTGGTAVPVWSHISLVSRAPARATALESVAALVSYLPSPLSPPPQV